MEVIFLGTGTSQGVPLIACDCEVCRSTDLRNKRTRTSVHVMMDGLHVQVDAAPEFRLQCIQNRVTAVDLFILSHGHSDHIAGMDDLRRYCDLLGGHALPVYSTEEGLSRVRSMFPYAIVQKAIVKGYPAFNLNLMPARLDLPQGTIESTILPHGPINTLGLVFTERSSGKRFAYYTDCKRVPAEAMALAKGADLIVLDGLRPDEHSSHMTVSEAVTVALELAAPQTFLTHMTHQLEHVRDGEKLPDRVAFAHDGLRVNL
jgi:phosphoribosyl 1,2-cyclic phosphate phosphodiesterase